MPSHQITQNSPKIDRVLHLIEEGDYKIPPFQRGFVWELEQVLALLDSIYQDYPIGTILLWNTTEKLRTQRNLAGFLLPDRPDHPPAN